MRVRITYTGTVSSCGTTTYGEVEDYCVYVGTPGLWIGGAASAPTDWNTAANWDDNRVPATSADIIIPNGLTYYPVTSGTLTCDDMTIHDNGSFTLQPGSNLTVNGNLAIGQAGSGTLNIDASTITVNGQITVNPGGAVNVTNGGTLTGN
jgi:T5SS/PEP-CTERM-associated repeat protein